MIRLAMSFYIKNLLIESIIDNLKKINAVFLFGRNACDKLQIFLLFLSVVI